MKRQIILTALLLTIGITTSSYANNELYYKKCLPQLGKATAINSCLSIVDRVEPFLKSAVLFVVSQGYAAKGDTAKAIEYQAMSVRLHLKKPPSNKSWDIKSFYAGYAFSYHWLASLESLRSLELSESLDEQGSIKFARRAKRNYTQAIALDASSHKSFAERAKIYSRFCKPDEAKRDFQAAAEIARSLGDREAVIKYIAADSYGCELSYRGRLDD